MTLPDCPAIAILLRSDVWMASLEVMAEVSALVVGISYVREHLVLGNILFFELAGIPHDGQPGNLGGH